MNKPCGAVVRPPRRHGKVNAGASGRSVNADRPALLPRCPTPHSSPPNQCLPTDTSRPFCHIPQSIDTVAQKKKKQHPPPKKGTAAPKRTAPSRLCSAGKGPPGHEHKPCSGRGVKQFRIENIPFDSTPSLSRSSRLSPAPTGRQNTTVSWTSSAWLPISVCFSRRSDSWFRYLNSLFDTVGIRAQLRRTDPAGFVSRSGGTEGGSRKQPTNISEVRGQRLAESNPIKHRLRRPRRRAGAASDYCRASW